MEQNETLFKDAPECVIMVTHNKELARRADRVLTLEKGTILNTKAAMLDSDLCGAGLEKLCLAKSGGRTYNNTKQMR